MKHLVPVLLIFILYFTFSSCKSNTPSEPASEPAAADTPSGPAATETFAETNTPAGTAADTGTETETFTVTQTFSETETPTDTGMATETGTPTRTHTPTKTPTMTPIVIDYFDDADYVASYGGGVNVWSCNTDSAGGGVSRIDLFQVGQEPASHTNAINITGVVKCGSGTGYGYVEITITAYSSGINPSDISGYELFHFADSCSLYGSPSIKSVGVIMTSSSGDMISYAFIPNNSFGNRNVLFTNFTVDSGTLAGLKAALNKIIFRIYISDVPGAEYGYNYWLDDVVITR